MGMSGVMTDDRILIDPMICHGKPCIRGTRIMVKNIMGMFAGGYTIEKILLAYPELIKEDILAAIEYVTQLSDDVRVKRLPKRNAPLQGHRI